MTEDIVKLRKACRLALKVLADERENLIRGWSYGASGRREDVTGEGERMLRPIERALAAIDDALPPRKRGADQ